jgi:hypothetical protein
MIEFNRSGYTLSKRSSEATGIKGKGPPTSLIVLKFVDAVMRCVEGINGTSP